VTGRRWPGCGRRGAGRDRGSFTAREGALAASRGEPGAEAAARVAPPGAEVTVLPGAGSVTVRVRARVRVLGEALPVLVVEERATAAREPSAVGGVP
jgi:hypothetical protein